jgi:outer membrane lipoprotein-sorting protein
MIIREVKTLKKSIPAFLIFWLISSLTVTAEPSPGEIIKNYAVYFDQSFVGKMAMKTVKPGKEDREYICAIWVRGKDYSLLRYLSPEREKGTGCLKIKNTIYLYMPSVHKTITISGRNQLMNSNFSTADILGIDLINDYDYSLEGTEKIDETDHYIFLLKAKTRKAVYNTIKVWIRKQDYLPVKNEYYTTSGKLLRIMRYEGYGAFLKRANHPKRLIAENVLIKGEYSIITFLEGDFDKPIGDNVFTVGYLEHDF